MKEGSFMVYVLKYAFQDNNGRVYFDETEVELFSTKAAAEKRILEIGKEWHHEHESEIPQERTFDEIFESTESMADFFIELDFVHSTPSILFDITEKTVAKRE